MYQKHIMFIMWLRETQTKFSSLKTNSKHETKINNIHNIKTGGVFVLSVCFLDHSDAFRGKQYILFSQKGSGISPS